MAIQDRGKAKWNKKKKAKRDEKRDYLDPWVHIYRLIQFMLDGPVLISLYTLEVSSSSMVSYQKSGKTMVTTYLPQESPGSWQTPLLLIFIRAHSDGVKRKISAQLERTHRESPDCLPAVWSMPDAACVFIHTSSVSHSESWALMSQWALKRRPIIIQSSWKLWTLCRRCLPTSFMPARPLLSSLSLTS